MSSSEALARPAGKGSGQVVWGPHSRTPGTSYLPPVDDTPGPQAYDQEPRGLREPPLSIAFPGAARWEKVRYRLCIGIRARPRGLGLGACRLQPR